MFQMTSVLLVWICVLICAHSTAFVTRRGCSIRNVLQLRMVHINEPLSTYSLSSLPFTLRGKAVSIPSRSLSEEARQMPRLRIFRSPEEQIDSMNIPNSAYEIPILPDDEPMVLHTKRLQFAFSMMSRMVVDEVQHSEQKKLIKAFVDRDTGKLAPVGVLCEMVENRRFQTGEIAYVLQGLRRVNLLAFKQRRPFLTAMVDDVDQQASCCGASARDKMSFSDILSCEELCEDIYKDLTTILRLYKLLNHRDATPAPGFQIFTDIESDTASNSNSNANAPEEEANRGGETIDGDEGGSVDLASVHTTMSTPSSKSVVAELLKARTGTPGVELPMEIFRNRPIAAVEFTRDQLSEMHRYGEELLAQLTTVPLPPPQVQVQQVKPGTDSVPVSRKYVTGDTVEVTPIAKARTTPIARLRMLATTAMWRINHILRVPGKRLDKLNRTSVRLLQQILPTRPIAESPEPATVVAAPQQSSRQPLDLVLPVGSAMEALVQRMCAEVRTTQDNMRQRLSTMSAEVEAMSALLQYVEDRAQAEAQEVQLAQELDQWDDSLSPPQDVCAPLGTAHVRRTNSTVALDVIPCSEVDLTPLLQRHEAFSHAVCLPTASRDPQQLQQCLEMDTLSRLRTVASTMASDKEHLIQHALTDSLLTRRDVYELEDVDLGNDLDVRCYHEVNITHTLFVGMDDMQTQDTITSVPVPTHSKKLIVDDSVLSTQRRLTENVSSANEDPPEQHRAEEKLSQQLDATAWRSTLLHHISDKNNVNTAHVEGNVEAGQDVHSSSFFAVDGTFLQ